MIKLASYICGLKDVEFPKEADGSAINKLIVTLALGLPLLAGGLTGAAYSKLTSPQADIKNVQKMLIASEMEQALANMKRQRDAAALKERFTDGRTERSLHI